MENEIQDQRVRKDLKCLSLGDTAYSMLKAQARKIGLSASAYNRLLIQKDYKRNKNKPVEEVSTE